MGNIASARGPKHSVRRCFSLARQSPPPPARQGWQGQVIVKALITGASGFIGTHLATALSNQGHQVRCLVRRSSRTDQLSSIGAEQAYGDVTDPASVTAAVRGV